MRAAVRQKRMTRGFTLVEVIVVLVILAVLAAIMIPALTGWIDEAKKDAAIVEARTVLTAMQTIASERYGAGKTYTLADDEAATMALARVAAGGDIREAAVDTHALVTKMVYLTSQGVTVTYENGKFSIGGESTLFLNEGAMAKVYAALKADNTLPANTYFGTGLTGNAAKFASLIESLNEQGIDLNSGATTWAIRNLSRGSGTDYTNIYWTNEDLKNHAATEPYYAMVYTFATKHYTVRQVNVSNNGGTYAISSEVNGKVINDFNKLTLDEKNYYGVTGDDADIQSQANMLAIYNKILADGVYPWK